MDQITLSAFLRGDCSLPSPVAAIAIKGSYATGLYRRGSDLDLWICLGGPATREIHDVPQLVERHLKENLPDALTLDPPIEIDVTRPPAIAALVSRLQQVLQAERPPDWQDIEDLHELSTSKWLAGSLGDFADAELPTRDRRAGLISSWCAAAAESSHREARAWLDRPGNEVDARRHASALLDRAVAEACSAVLARYGWDNPKAKWRVRQAERLGGPTGHALATTLAELGRSPSPERAEELYDRVHGLIRE